jgi:hypothetical protein
MLDPGDVGNSGGDEDAFHICYISAKIGKRDQSSYKGTAGEARGIE